MHTQSNQASFNRIKKCNRTESPSPVLFLVEKEQSACFFGRNKGNRFVLICEPSSSFFCQTFFFLNVWWWVANSSAVPHQAERPTFKKKTAIIKSLSKALTGSYYARQLIIRAFVLWCAGTTLSPHCPSVRTRCQKY